MPKHARRSTIDDKDELLEVQRSVKERLANALELGWLSLRKMASLAAQAFCFFFVFRLYALLKAFLSLKGFLGGFPPFVQKPGPGLVGLPVPLIGPGGFGSGT